MPWYVNLPIVLLVLIVPFVLGGYLARKFRMPDHGWRIGLVLFALAAGLAVTITGWPPRLGIDLRGGVTLVYEIDQQKLAGRKVDMEALIAAISRRVNPGGYREVTIREYGKDQVEIIIPKAERAELDRIKSIITNLGSLEFRILASDRNANDKKLIDQAKQTDAETIYSTGTKHERLAWWVPVDDKEVAEFKSGGGGIAVRPDPKDAKVLQVLVLQDPFNVEGKYLENSSPGVDRQGRPCVKFSFDSTGAKLFGGLTGNNLPDEVTGFARRLGIILNGKLFSAPNIQSTIFDQGEITGQFTDKDVKSLVSVLNAGALPAALVTEPISELVTGPTLGRDTIQRGAVAIAVSFVLVLVFMLVYYRFAGVVACMALLMNLILILAIIIMIQAELTLTGLAGLVLTVGMAVDANVLIYERIREELDRQAALRMAIRNGFTRAATAIYDSNLTTLITAVVLYVIGTDQIRGFAVTLFLGVSLSMFTAIFCARVVFDVGERQRWIGRLSMMRMLGRTQIDFLSVRRLCGVISSVIIVVGLAGVIVRASGLLDIDFTGGVSVYMMFKEKTDTKAVRHSLENLPPGLVAPDTLDAMPEGLFALSDAEDIRKLTDEQDTELAGVLRSLAQQKKLPADLSGLGDVTSLKALVNNDQKLANRLVTFISLADLARTGSLPDLTVSDVEWEGERGRVFVINTSCPNTSVVQQCLEAVFPDELETNSLKVESLSEIAATGTATEKPAAKTKTPATKTEKPPTETKKPAAKTEKPPTETKKPAAKTEKPPGPAGKPAADDKGEKQSRSDLPPRSLLASIDPAAVLLAQAEPGEAKPAAKPADKPTKPAEIPAATPSKKPVSEPPGEVVPVEQAPAPAKKPSEAAGPGELTSTAVTPYAGGTQATLEFSHKIDHDTLFALLTEQIGKGEGLSLAVTNKEYTKGSNTPYGTWDVEVAMPPESAKAVFQKIQQDLEQQPYFPSSAAIGGKVAGGARNRAIAALIASLVFIIGYIWVRFQRVTYGLAAVLALVHDVLITLGAIALSFWLAPFLGVLGIDQFKIGLPVLAAFLTIIGYSLNDTIIVFDRIREVKGKSPRLTDEMVNSSVNQTLSRTLITSGTTLIVVLVLYIGGGQGIHAFAFAMLVGVIAGTYSSIYVASALLLWMTGASRAPAKK